MDISRVCVCINNHLKTDLLEKTLMLGKIEGKGMIEDEMVGWHHRLDGHEVE